MLGETYLGGREVPELLIHTSGKALSFLAQLRRGSSVGWFVEGEGRGAHDTSFYQIKIRITKKLNWY
jgi:hypothetical protein